MENVLQASYDIKIVEIFDDSEIQLISLVYDKRTNEFILKIENTGDVDVYVSPEIIDLFVNDEYLNFGIEEPVLIKAGKSKNIRIPAEELSDDDIRRNRNIRVKSYYGERETTLFKVAFAEFKFEFKKANYYVYIVYVFR